MFRNPGPWSESGTNKRSFSHWLKASTGASFSSIGYITRPWSRSGEYTQKPVPPSRRPNTPYTRVSSRIGYAGPSYTEFKEANIGIRLYGLGAPPLPDLSITGEYSAESVSVRNAALVDFYSNLHGSQAQVLAFLGELGESVRMIAGAASALSRAIHAHYPKRPLQYWKRRLGKGFSEAPNYWLEGVFGWSPLVGDVINFAETAAEIANGFKHLYIKVSGSSHRNYTSRYVGQSGIEFVSAGITTCTSSIETDIGWHFQCNRTLAVEKPSATQLLGLTLWDVVPSVYEIIPYSWLVDYFSNIGDIISCMSTSLVGTHPGFSNSRLTRTNKWEHVLPPYSNGTAAYTRPRITETGDEVYRSFGRSLWTPGEMPAFQLEVPGATQAINVSAVLSGQLERFRRFP